MSIRKITSLTALLAFLVMLLTSIILYIVPHGRVAYWADWRLWGLSKDQWGAIHINSGFLFLLALMLHIYYNWKPILLYLKNRAKQLILLTREFNVAFLLTVVCVLGTYLEVPPFVTIINIGDQIKGAATQKYGEPPYGHAELSSLKVFAKKLDIDVHQGMEQLRKAGFAVDQETQTLKEIAQANNVSPQQVYLAMAPSAQKSLVSPGSTVTLPEDPAPGTGNLTLADFCSQYKLDMQMILRSLEESNIAAKKALTLKEIGKANNSNPVDIYEKIKEIVQRSGKK